MFVRLIIAPLVLIYALAAASPTQALQTFYVANSGAGTACTYTAPCASISTALSAASAGDDIICITPPGPYPLIITKAITIDCSTARAPFLGGGVLGTPDGAAARITINIPAGNALQSVRLRGFAIHGDIPTGIFRGIHIQAAGAVYIEDCVISNNAQQGIYDHRTGGQTFLSVKDSIITGNSGAGIVAGAQATGITVLDNVSLLRNGYGLAAATGNNVFISRSVISGNKTAGVEADAGAQVDVSNSAITHNSVNVQAFGRVRLRENDIKFSNTAVQGSGAVSMGANRFSGNGAIGTTPTLATGAPADVFN